MMKPVFDSSFVTKQNRIPYLVNPTPLSHLSASYPQFNIVIGVLVVACLRRRLVFDVIDVSVISLSLTLDILSSTSSPLSPLLPLSPLSSIVTNQPIYFNLVGHSEVVALSVGGETTWDDQQRIKYHIYITRLT
jgi:hypothetical protein